MKKVIHEYWEKELPEVIDRDISVDLKTDLINDIVGIRRSGKTFLMFNIIRKLLKKLDKHATIYINFENRKLLPMKQEYFNDIIEFIYAEKLFEKYKKIYLFLDEVQRIEGWEKFIRSIYDEFKGRIKIFVSGSSANLLSKDYGKLLTGRHLTTVVFPLSFKEFLRFKKNASHFLSCKGGEVYKFSCNKKISAKKISNIQIKILLKEYLQYGGFPEVVLSGKKEELLNQLFSDVISKDVVSRADIRKEQILEEFSYYLSSNISNKLSFNKISRYFKSKGVKVSVQTLENYFYFMKNAFVFFDNLIFSYKAKDQLQYSRKIYCIDNGLANLIGFKFSEDAGKLYENAVAAELLRRSAYSPGTKIFYWHDQQQREVDFVVKMGIKVKELIQVCYDTSDPEAERREIKGLARAMDEFELKEGTIITRDLEDKKKVEGKIIICKPLWKWLLT